ncbi:MULTISPECIES: heavy-metal-associated domain-containing protein [unclassified Arthrobacter]|uniref:heavy-metal-associated domain-containing protein n=1 Tax=unclassified Arthrobacter TaxID=235627 RepID=UPI00047B1F09|nr:heavy-metal-associated domain-containing protein [Arthrobacter sp. Br18]
MSTTTVNVTGMTCGHCVEAVKSELSALPGVQSVEIDLVKGGLSATTITSEGALDSAQVNDAVAEAGYSVASSDS